LEALALKRLISLWWFTNACHLVQEAVEYFGKAAARLDDLLNLGSGC
jgi:cobalamin biosynthesis protein CobD/CbiB